MCGWVSNAFLLEVYPNQVQFAGNLYAIQVVPEQENIMSAHVQPGAQDALNVDSHLHCTQSLKAGTDIVAVVMSAVTCG